MNILVVGNGFDLAHKLPTSYNCCLDFLRAIHLGEHVNKSNSPDFLKQDDNECRWTAAIEKVDPLLQPFIQERERGIDPELYKLLLDCIADNFWLEYFLQRQDMYRSYQKNWIDLEQEIARVICFIQDAVDKAREHSPGPDYLSKEPFTRPFTPQGEHFDVLYAWFSRHLLKKEQRYLSEEALRKFIDLLYEELEKFTTSIEIYLSLCQKIVFESKSCRLPDIEKIDSIDRVLSFNYTNTFIQYMRTPYDSEDVCHVHGRLRSPITDFHSPLVLGIDEYLSDNEKDANVEFVMFKKYFQRIYKYTDYQYLRWREAREGEQNRDGFSDYLYIFGHSLDVTDKDVLQQLIRRKYTKTTIFYQNSEQFSCKLKNLVKVIGSDELNERTRGMTPSVFFKKQIES